MRSAIVLLFAVSAFGADGVTIRFRGPACGEKMTEIGTTRAGITLRDFRFYVHNVRLLDAAGEEVPVDLEQDGKWQADDVALIDLCGTNRQVAGTVPGSGYQGLRFTLGVPFQKNHADLTSLPSPLNLTAMAWTWTTGHRFLRLEFKGYAVHLGSTGCVPGRCSSPNLVEVEIREFDPAKDAVIADLAALLADSNVEKGPGCESDPATVACGPLFAHFGLPFNGQPARAQTFFHK